MRRWSVLVGAVGLMLLCSIGVAMFSLGRSPLLDPIQSMWDDTHQQMLSRRMLDEEFKHDEKVFERHLIKQEQTNRRENATETRQASAATSTEYIGAPLSIDPATGTPFQDTIIKRLQHPHDCSTAPIFLMKTPESGGFGALIRSMALCLQAAVRMNRTLVLQGEMHVYSSGIAQCQGRGYECFVQPVSTCRPTDWAAGDLQTVESLRELYDTSKPFKRVIQVNAYQCRMPTDSVYMREEAWLDFVPAKYAAARPHMFHGNMHMAWYGECIRWIMRPNAEASKFVNDLKQRIQWPAADRAVIGVHIRHGDKAAEMKSASNFTSAEYMKAIKHLLTLLPADNPQMQRPSAVYLATDDENIVKTATTAFAPWPVLSLGGSALRGFYMESLLRTEVNMKRQAALEVMADMLLLSESRYLFGTCSSGVTTVPAAIRASSPNALPLPITMEADCNNWWLPDASPMDWWPADKLLQVTTPLT